MAPPPRLVVSALAPALSVLLVACGDSGTESEPQPPSLALGSSSVTLTAAVWDEPVSATVAVSNAGDGTVDGLSVSVAYPSGGAEDWLDAVLDRTTAPATLLLEARTQPRSGTYAATVTVASASTGTRQDVAVSLELTPRPLLYLIEHDADVLRRMDPSSLSIHDIGPLGVGFDFGDCAWDSDAGTLYMVDGRGQNRLYTVDLATGAATPVGTHGVRDLFAIEYHGPSQTLYAAGGVAPRYVLYRLDRETGEATEVGELSRAVHGLAWDAQRQQMVAVRASNANALLMTVDLATAALTILDGTVAVDNHGIGYDPQRDVFWAADWVGTVFRFDPVDGFAVTEVAAGTGSHTCLAYVP
ncbi:MAG: hypothetical protein RLN75_03060 [Longimicrobiales bacterium]